MQSITEPNIEMILQELSSFLASKSEEYSRRNSEQDTKDLIHFVKLLGTTVDFVAHKLLPVLNHGGFSGVTNAASVVFPGLKLAYKLKNNPWLLDLIVLGKLIKQVWFKITESYPTELNAHSFCKMCQYMFPEHGRQLHGLKPELQERIPPLLQDLEAIWPRIDFSFVGHLSPEDPNYLVKFKNIFVRLTSEILRVWKPGIDEIVQHVLTLSCVIPAEIDDLLLGLLERRHDAVTFICKDIVGHSRFPKEIAECMTWFSYLHPGYRVEVVTEVWPPEAMQPDVLYLYHQAAGYFHKEHIQYRCCLTPSPKLLEGSIAAADLGLEHFSDQKWDEIQNKIINFLCDKHILPLTLSMLPDIQHCYPHMDKRLTYIVRPKIFDFIFHAGALLHCARSASMQEFQSGAVFDTGFLLVTESDNLYLFFRGMAFCIPDSVYVKHKISTEGTGDFSLLDDPQLADAFYQALLLWFRHSQTKRIVVLLHDDTGYTYLYRPKKAIALQSARVEAKDFNLLEEHHETILHHVQQHMYANGHGYEVKDVMTTYQTVRQNVIHGQLFPTLCRYRELTHLNQPVLQQRLQQLQQAWQEQVMAEETLFKRVFEHIYRELKALPLETLYTRYFEYRYNLTAKPISTFLTEFNINLICQSDLYFSVDRLSTEYSLTIDENPIALSFNNLYEHLNTLEEVMTMSETAVETQTVPVNAQQQVQEEMDKYRSDLLAQITALKEQLTAVIVQKTVEITQREQELAAELVKVAERQCCEILVQRLSDAIATKTYDPAVMTNGLFDSQQAYTDFIEQLFDQDECAEEIRKFSPTKSKPKWYKSADDRISKMEQIRAKVVAHRDTLPEQATALTQSVAEVTGSLQKVTTLRNLMQGLVDDFSAITTGEKIGLLASCDAAVASGWLVENLKHTIEQWMLSYFQTKQIEAALQAWNEGLAALQQDSQEVAALQAQCDSVTTQYQAFSVVLNTLEQHPLYATVKSVVDGQYQVILEQKQTLLRQKQQKLQRQALVVKITAEQDRMMAEPPMEVSEEFTRLIQDLAVINATESQDMSQKFTARLKEAKLKAKVLQVLRDVLTPGDNENWSAQTLDAMLQSIQARLLELNLASDARRAYNQAKVMLLEFPWREEEQSQQETTIAAYQRILRAAGDAHIKRYFLGMIDKSQKGLACHLTAEQREIQRNIEYDTLHFLRQPSHTIKEFMQHQELIEAQLDAVSDVVLPASFLYRLLNFFANLVIGLLTAGIVHQYHYHQETRGTTFLERLTLFREQNYRDYCAEIREQLDEGRRIFSAEVESAGFAMDTAV